jgi:hypothetical protein
VPTFTSRSAIARLRVYINFILENL